MRVIPAGVVFALMFAGPAFAERTTEAFYADAMALKAKGPMALFSSKLKPLMAEGKAAGEAMRQQRLAAQKRGEKPAYCPPEGGTMGQQEMMDGLARIPQAERRSLPLSQGMARVLAAKYPCR